MKTMVKRLCIYATAAAFVSWAPLAHAQQAAGRQGPQADRGQELDNFIKDLNLTPQQQEQIKKQRNEHFEKNRGAGDELRQKRLKLKQELEKEVPDRKLINALVADINTLTARKLQDRVDSILAIKEILTPQQYKAFQEKIRSHAGPRREGPWQ
ncbi:MAG TPA: periplasmic heavy metal sensor [Patescibacteria group bacterium]|nr:periplasmic heavy metal sensor [Patescibacteria group bacterium]